MEIVIKDAAILRDGLIWTLPRPARHHNIVWAMNDVDHGSTPETRPAGALLKATGEQGFIDGKGKFLNRIDAAKEAIASGQLIKPLIAPPNLFSEDLW